MKNFSGWHSKNHWGDISNLWAEILPDILNWIVEDFQISIFRNIGSGPLESPNTTSNLSFKKSLHLQEWVNTSQNMAVLQAATILVPSEGEWKIYLATKISTKVADW